MAGVLYRHDSICLNKFVGETCRGNNSIFLISDGNLSSLEILISVTSRLFCTHYLLIVVFSQRQSEERLKARCLMNPVKLI